jgi:hypothetical protein
MFSKTFIAALWTVALVVALILVLMGVRSLGKVPAKGVAGLFVAMVAACLAMVGPAPEARSADLARTTAVLATLLQGEAPAWARSSAWQALLTLWQQLLDHEKAKGGGTTEADLGVLKKKAGEVYEKLEAMVKVGKLPQATLDAAKAIIDHQLWHIDRLRASCYEPMPVGYFELETLQQRLPLLKKLRAGGKVDAWLYERAMKGLEDALYYEGMDAGNYAGRLKQMTDSAVPEALLTQRYFDEYRIATLVDTEEWQALRKKAEFLFKGAGAPELRKAEEVEKSLLPIVKSQLLEARGAAYLAKLLTEISMHNFHVSPLAPSCYDMTVEGERRMQRRGKMATFMKELKGGEQMTDMAWSDKFKQFSALLFEAVAKPAKDAQSADDPAFLLLAAQVFDLVRHLAP